MLFNLPKLKLFSFNPGPILLAWILCSTFLISCLDEKPAPENNSKTSAENPAVEEPAQQLGHIVLQVSNLEQSQQFYEEILHMNTNEEAVYDGQQRIFLSATNSHHELVLKEGLKEHFETNKRYLQQLAFRVRGREELADYYRRLNEKGIDIELTDNQVSWSLYFYDPDSVYIEIYWDIRNRPFGKEKTNGIQQELTAAQLLE